MIKTILLLGLAGLCSGADILAMLPLPTFSHTNAYLPIFEELARRGHNVTVVSPYPRKEPIPNYKDIVVTNTLEEIMSRFNFDLHDFNNFIPNLLGIWSFCPNFLDAVLPLPEVQNIINNDRSHFDLIVTETWFCQEPFTALAHKYSAHLIAIHPLAMGSIEAHYTGNTVPYSYVPHIKDVSSEPFSFKERLFSTIFYTSELLLTKFLYLPKQEKYMRDNFKYPGSENLPPLEEILKNHSLILIDNHLSLSYPKPYMPNIVEFGGLSVKQAKPLPKDLEDYINGAKDGVVFLSWGSHYKSTNMKPHTLAKFLSVFSKLKQRVLMKWENPDLPGKPDNVRIAPWFPQASILSHPNLKAFISHCGIHGIAETTYHGVPVLGTPLFADQYQNLKVAENAGYGIFLDIDSFTEELLLDAINKLIHDPSYKKAALKQSNIFKDRPLHALNNSVYWIEYVLRHDGAKHLRPHGIHLSWYKYFLLDIIGLAVGGLLILLFATVCILRILFCRSNAPRPTPKSKKSKKE